MCCRTKRKKPKHRQQNKTLEDEGLITFFFQKTMIALLTSRNIVLEEGIFPRQMEWKQIFSLTTEAQ